MTIRFSSLKNAYQAMRSHTGGRAIRLYIPGAAAEPLALADDMAQDPEMGRGVTCVGVWIPGMNATDWASLCDGAQTTFATPAWSTSRRSGRLKILPLAYSQTWDWISRTPIDAAIVQVSPPDARGLCSYSLTADFTDAVLNRDVPVLGLLNPMLPVVRGAPSVSIDRFQWVAEVAHPPATYDAGGDDALSRAVAAQVARLIDDGFALQTGIGKLPVAIMDALKDRRGLRIHSGMVADSLISLIDAGAIASGEGAITAGAIMGSPTLGRRLADDPRVRLVSVPNTHGYGVVSRIPGLAAVNSALEVDLFGQANAERTGARLVSSVGGLGDFLRGAGAAPGGLPIVALPSETANGKISKIVPLLSPGVVTVGRTEIGIVVTEHGAADLRGLDTDARAEALIAIAAPIRRDELAQAWAELRAQL